MLGLRVSGLIKFSQVSRRSASRPRVRGQRPRPARQKRGDTPFTQRRTDVGMVYNGARSQVCVGRARGSPGAIV